MQYLENRAVRWNGTGGFGGIAQGRLHYYRNQKKKVLRLEHCDPHTEWQRFVAARDAAVASLRKLSVSLSVKGHGTEMAALLSAHETMAEDAGFATAIKEALAAGVNAEYAVDTVAHRQAKRLSKLEDMYLRERATDLLDVAERIQKYLARDFGREAADFSESNVRELKSPVVLVAEEIAPSELLQFDRNMLLAIVLRQGNAIGHAAILAGILGIPYVYGIEEADFKNLIGTDACLRDGSEASHQTVYVDGEKALIELDPTEENLLEWERKLHAQEEAKHFLAALIGLPSTTADGRHLPIRCNISTPEDVSAVLANDGEGIGLFRTEFAYLTAPEFPTEDSLYESYRSAAERMQGKPVVIRTLDLSVDKQPAFLGNANRGIEDHGIRFCLARPMLFKTQLRAIYRASAVGNVSMMFPMIRSLAEIAECKQYCTEVTDALKREGLPFDEELQVGIMVETQEAIRIIEALAECVDFFSVGTNDLTRALMNGSTVTAYAAEQRSTVLAAIDRATRAAHRGGIPIGICGEMAADELLLPVFARIGIDELSVSPAKVLPIRNALRRIGSEN